jgi:hypothetical protein
MDYKGKCNDKCWPQVKGQMLSLKYMKTIDKCKCYGKSLPILVQGLLIPSVKEKYKFVCLFDGD